MAKDRRGRCVSMGKRRPLWNWPVRLDLSYWLRVCDPSPSEVPASLLVAVSTVIEKEALGPALSLHLAYLAS